MLNRYIIERRGGFAGLKATVLSHVAEIRRHQADFASAKLARGLGRKDYRENLLVGPRQGADQDNAPAGDIAAKAQIGLSIREIAGFDCADVAAAKRCQFLRHGLVARQGDEERDRHGSAIRIMSALASA